MSKEFGAVVVKMVLLFRKAELTFKISYRSFNIFCTLVKVLLAS